MATSKPAGCFVDVTPTLNLPEGPWVDPIHRPLTRRGRPLGPLAGLSFAVKDLFDVEGTVTGAGNPAWAASAPVATADAPVVAALLDAGATLVGKTITDELAFSLSGTNVHLGTPPNPAAPGRVPGGSSAGSASAVALGRCDIAIGTDTGGSVRVPASYCGVWGMRPTHGRVPLEGAVGLAPSLDTAGWFARDPGVLAAVGAVLLGTAPPPVVAPARRVLVVDPLLRLADEPCRERLGAAAERLADAAGLVFARSDGRGLEPWWEAGHPTDWLVAFRAIQGAEAWALHGAWVERGLPMGPGVRARFLAGRDVTVGDLARAAGVRERARRALEAVLGDGTVLAVPAASGEAPLASTAGSAKDDLRLRTLRLTCAAGLAGLPVISAPLASTPGGRPVGLCLIGAPWADEELLALAAAAR